MALSNIANEPRREIIEQVAGVAVFIIYVGGTYALVKWLGATNTEDVIFGTLLGLVAIPLLLIVLFLLSLALHWLGEGVCALLAKAGADPRPTQRYRR